jgi:hypothetical protein
VVGVGVDLGKSLRQYVTGQEVIDDEVRPRIGDQFAYALALIQWRLLQWQRGNHDTAFPLRIGHLSAQLRAQSKKPG